MAEYPFLACRPVQLPMASWLDAARTAVAENPANRPARLGRLAGAPVLQPAHLALLTSKYWGAGGVKLGVQFLDRPTAKLKNKILKYANEWGETANVSFKESAKGEVRLARKRGDGYWSYLGTDILSVPRPAPTLNLDSFSLLTPESEFRRVVPHEFGHTAGFPHEHARPEIVSLLDPAKTIAYFQSEYGWPPDMTQEQVLTPLDPLSIRATEAADQTSVMTYQFDGACTYSGEPIPGGLDLDDLDRQFAATLYPKPGGRRAGCP